MTVLKIIILLVFIITVSGEADFQIAGLFPHNSSEISRDAFLLKADYEDSGVESSYSGKIFQPSIVTDSYSIALEVCQNTLSRGTSIAALLDVRPTEGICDTTCLLCNKLNIPHLTVGWEPVEPISEQSFTFSYYPPPALVSKAYANLIRTLGWYKFSFLYEDEGSFVRLQDVIGSWPHSKDSITYRQLIPNGQNRETFKYILKTARITHHIIDCDIANIEHYMMEIIQVENSTLYQSFILTNLDSHTVNLSLVLGQMKGNISTMYMTNTDTIIASSIQTKNNRGAPLLIETALIGDALEHLEAALKTLETENQEAEETEADVEDINIEAPPALCFKQPQETYDDLKFSFGARLREALIKTKMDSNGYTGPLEFDENGRRTNIRLIYAKINSQGEYVNAGTWISTEDIIRQDNVPDNSIQAQSVIRVLSLEALPYFQTVTHENGETTVRGFAVDFVNEIFEYIKINKGLSFELSFSGLSKGQHGAPEEGTRKWTGLIGELMEHKADLGVCDLSITSERNAVVDFSVPFMSTGISMLFKEREPDNPDMFSFINPLSLDVWLYLATTYIIVSFVFLLCSRMSNLDWVNPHPCNQNPENLENIWSFYNCTWFAMGTIMTQGCDILPRGLGSRWIAGMWWFFAMIVTASYTANMSTFLSNNRRDNDIKNVQELSEQTQVSYGAVINSSTYYFFKNSNDTVYSKIWQVMSSTKPTVFTKDNDAGRDRVLQSKGKRGFAFFMESSAIKYYLERNCNLTMVGSPLDSKSFGIAMPKNFPHKSLLDEAILHLQEQLRIEELTNKWWKEEDKNPDCNRKKGEEVEDDGSLQMKNTGGIFLVLGVGGILGVIVAIIDFMIHANKIAVKEKVTFKEALKSEWNASLDPRTLAKPVAPPRSAPPSSGSPTPQRERSTSRAVSVLRAATSFINFDEIY